MKGITEVPAQLGENPSPKSDKVKELEKKLVTIATAVVKTVTKFSNAYKHDERAIRRINSASKSKTLVEMTKAYTDIKIAFKQDSLPDEYFAGERREVYLTIAKLLHDKFFDM